MKNRFHVMSKLLDDENLRYKFTGEYSGKERPTQMAGKLILKIRIRMFLFKFKSMTTHRATWCCQLQIVKKKTFY
jgi:hypothetical protein